MVRHQISVEHHQGVSHSKSFPKMDRSVQRGNEFLHVWSGGLWSNLSCDDKEWTRQLNNNWSEMLGMGIGIHNLWGPFWPWESVTSTPCPNTLSWAPGKQEAMECEPHVSVAGIPTLVLFTIIPSLCRSEDLKTVLLKYKLFCSHFFLNSLYIKHSYF